MPLYFLLIFCIPACSSYIPYYIGDGYCEDENNNDGCGFDGGDCCGTDVITAYCSKCECLGENITSTALPGPFCSCSMEDPIGCELLIFFHRIIRNRLDSIFIFKAVNSLAILMMVIVMILQILQNATMMEVIVVDLTSTHIIVLIVPAMF